jgi:type I restriction enzyme R subunit
MNNQNMKKRFKDPEDPFALAFVCSMWLTGFDVPVLSTMYLDKPMKNHTLMQAIARTNRVYEEKKNGLIVDYLGVFKNLEKALSLYTKKEDVDITPVQEKEELVKKLGQEVREMDSFCKDYSIDIDAIIEAEDMDKINAIDEAVDQVVSKEDIKEEFLNREQNIRNLFDAILPDEAADKYKDKKDAIHTVAKTVRSMEREDVDISDVKQDMEELINRSIDVEDYVIHDPIGKKDLSQINFDKVREQFEDSENKHTESESLKNKLEKKVEEMTKKNPERIDYKEKLEKLIEEYNNNAYNVERYFQKLMDFAEELDEEEQRAVKEGLNEEELALFDLLYKDNLDQEEEERVKAVAKELLEKLKKSALIEEWKTTQRRRVKVKSIIHRSLWDNMPRNYEEKILNEKETDVYEHIYRAYESAEENVYV